MDMDYCSTKDTLGISLYDVSVSDLNKLGSMLSADGNYILSSYADYARISTLSLCILWSTAESKEYPMSSIALNISVSYGSTN